jgi:gamma-glutamylcysteine synthetase
MIFHGPFNFQHGFGELNGAGMRDEIGAKLGLEMEMAVVRRASGESHAVSAYAESMARIKQAQGCAVAQAELGGRACGVSGIWGDSGLDNGYNLLETAFAPVAGGEGGLARLAAAVRQELQDVQQALEPEDATILNVSEHPAASLAPERYEQVRVPRPIYTELTQHRGWLHRAGIDAKAQNGPCTAVPVHHAARALNVILALAPASAALFANSPLQEGRLTGFKENRLMLWQRMFRHARFPGDFMLQQLPKRPFEDLGDYFRWMFGAGTASRSLPLAGHQEYKSATSIYLDGDPPLGQFLDAPAWPGRRADTGEPVQLRPESAHFEYSQFAHFLDARWRYRLERQPPLAELRDRWRQPGGIEALYAELGVDGYIEGRVPGAVFPDAQLCAEAGDAVAQAAPLAASALQLGLMRNLGQSEALVREWGWLPLRRLRSRAIRDALGDDAVHALARDVLAVAAGGLEPADRHWLGYAEFVLETRRTGADRLLRLWSATPGRTPAKLAAVYEARALRLPPRA